MKPFLRFRGSGFFILHHLLLDATIRAGGPLPAPSSGALFPQEECYLCCTEDLPTAFIALPALNHTPNGSPEVRAPLFIVFYFFLNPFNGRVAHTRAAGLSSASCSGRAARDVLQGPPPRARHLPKITRKEAPRPQPFRQGTSPWWLEGLASPTYPAQGTRIWTRGLSGCQQCPQMMPQQLQTRAVQHTSPACPSPLPAPRAGELQAPPRCSNSPPFADAFDL